MYVYLDHTYAEVSRPLVTVEVEVEVEVVVVAVVQKYNRKEITITCMSPLVEYKGRLRLAPGVDVGWFPW